MRGPWLGVAVCAAILLLAVPNPAPASDFPFAEKPTPTAGPAMVIGKVSAGCLAGGVSVDLGKPDMVVLRPQRNRHWGHPELVTFLDDLAASVVAQGLDPILLGDMSQPRGGPMPWGHRSHQSGLDADIWFMGTQSPPHTADWIQKPKAISMVAGDGISTDPSLFTPSRRAALLIAAADPRVDRIFINPAIKSSLCRLPDNDRPAAEVLRKLRSWWGHDSHFHIRLRCPEGQTACVPQDPIPPGAGCGEDLDWWLGRMTPRDAAAAPPPVTTPRPRPGYPPVLPDACMVVLTDP